MVNPVKINDIFHYQKSYYKVISVKQINQFTKHEFYNVIKCNKNGVEFSTKTNFIASFVEKAERWRAIKNEKASTANKDIGEMKRRVNYLKGKIKVYSEELAELEEQLNSRQ
jgi:hypothetical protein